MLRRDNHDRPRGVGAGIAAGDDGGRQGGGTAAASDKGAAGAEEGVRSAVAADAEAGESRPVGGSYEAGPAPPGAGAADLWARPWRSERDAEPPREPVRGRRGLDERDHDAKGGGGDRGA